MPVIDDPASKHSKQDFALLIISLLALFVISALPLRFPVYVIGASAAIGICGLSSRKIGDLGFLFLAIAAAFLVSFTVNYATSGAMSYEILLFVSVTGALIGATLNSMSGRYNPAAILLGSAMAMWLFSAFRYEVPAAEMATALVFSLLVGYFAYRIKVINMSGVLSATLVGVLIILFGNMTWFLILLSFFVVGGIFTKYKYEFKSSLKIAQATRGYKNVFGNGLCALVMAIGFKFNPVFLLGFLGAVAAATSDTLATEIGETQKKQPFLMTTFERVPPGTSGAVSPLGEASAVIGSAFIASLAILLGMANSLGAATVLITTTIGGFVGTQADSILGATLERRKILNNHTVNLLATIIGAAVSIGVYYI
jgi:uncharacterized protein (TIGR00297 family)